MPLTPVSDTRTGSYGPGSVLGPTRSYASVCSGSPGGSVSVPSPADEGADWDERDPEGPVPKDTSTPEMQRSFAEIVALIRQHNELEEETTVQAGVKPSGMEKFWGTTQEPKPSLGLPWSELTESVLDQVNSLVSGRENSLRSSRSTKLLPPPLPKQRKVYTPSAAAVPTLRVDPDLVRLGPGLTLDYLKGGEVSLSQLDASALESTAMATLQAVSWLDRWSLAVSQIASSASANLPPQEQATLRRLMLSGGKTVSFLAHQSANLWANLVLKRRDAVLSRITRVVGAESALQLRNGPLLGSPYLFARDGVDVAVDRRRCDDNDRLIHQVVSGAPDPPRGTTARPSGRVGNASEAPRKSQAFKGPRKGTQPSSAPAKKSTARNFPPPSRGRGGGKGKKKGGGR